MTNQDRVLKNLSEAPKNKMSAVPTLVNLDKLVDDAFEKCQSDVDNFVNALHELQNNVFKHFMSSNRFF